MKKRFVEQREETSDPLERISSRARAAKEGSPMHGVAHLCCIDKRWQLDLHFADQSWALDVHRGAGFDAARALKSFSIEGSREFQPLTKGVPASELPSLYGHASLEKELPPLPAEAFVTEMQFDFEPGLMTAKSFEYFISKNEEFIGQLRIERSANLACAQPWLATLIDSKFIPNAVLKNAPMPGEGLSALPGALEKAIPEEFRYWLHKGIDAQRVRDALVASEFFKSHQLANVDGEIGVIKMVYAVVDTAPALASVPADWPLLKAASLLSPNTSFIEVFSPAFDEIQKSSDAGKHVVYIDAGEAPIAAMKHLSESLAKHAGDYVITAIDSPAARDGLAMMGRVFKFIPGGEIGVDAIDRVFVASFGVRADDIRWVDKADGDEEEYRRLRVYSEPSADSSDLGKAEFNKPDPGGAGDIKQPPTDPDPDEQKKADLTTGGPGTLQPAVQFDIAGNPKVRDPRRAGAHKKFEDAFIEILKAQKDDSEEHYVLGIVLEPDVVDAQNDIYSADEVREASYKYMSEFQNRGLMHQTIVNNKVDILESYCAPCDFTVGDQHVKMGTWLMAVRVKDPALWQEVKTGGLTGFSIGGSANRQPDEIADKKYKSRAAAAEHKTAFQGIPVVVDRPKGYVQEGVDKEGNAWTREYKTDYGFIPQTKGGDGEGLDVFLGPNGNSPFAYWVTQRKDDNTFDEYKVILGCDSIEAAKKLYLDHVPEKYFGGIVEGSVHQIKALLNQDPKMSLTAA